MSDTGTVESPSPQQGRSVRRLSSQQTLAANRRNICATSFDFLGGSFRTAARLRLSVIVVAGVVVIVNLLIVGGGFRSMFQARQLRDARVTLQRQYDREAATFGATTGLDADRNAKLLQRDETLSSSLEYLMSVQASLPELLNAAIALPDVRVTGVDFNMGRTAPAPGAAAPAPSAGVPFAITAESDSFAAIKPWVESLQTNPALTGVTTRRDGRGLIVSGTFVGTQPSSSLELLASLGLRRLDTSGNATPVAPATPTTPTTVPATTVPQGGK